jgi:hypothetical protein
MGHAGPVAESHAPRSPSGTVSRPRTTSGKRNVQQQKREKAQAKQVRRAARRLEGPEADGPSVEATEAELIDELAAIHSALETATLSPEEFEARRDTIRLQLEQIERGRNASAGDPPGVCGLCGLPAVKTVEPARRTLARGEDPDDPSLSVIGVLPDVQLCEDHSGKLDRGELALGWCDDERCRLYGESGVASPCGALFQALKR